MVELNKLQTSVISVLDKQHYQQWAAALVEHKPQVILADQVEVAATGAQVHMQAVLAQQVKATRAAVNGDWYEASAILPCPSDLIC